MAQIWLEGEEWSARWSCVDDDTLAAIAEIVENLLGSPNTLT